MLFSNENFYVYFNTIRDCYEGNSLMHLSAILNVFRDLCHTTDTVVLIEQCSVL